MKEELDDINSRKMFLQQINLVEDEDINPYNYGEFYSWGKRWVNYGENNDWLDYLLTLYISSPTHQAVVDGTINLATGEGVETIDPEKNPLTNQFINENFSKNVIKKLLSDLKIYGFCAIKIYSGKLVEYSEAIKYRADIKDENGHDSKYIWYSENWNHQSGKNNRPVKLPKYQEGTDEPLSISIVQLDKKGMEYYSPVDYSGSINYIILEKDISTYHIANIKNSFNPSYFVTVFGDSFPKEVRDDYVKKLNSNYSGPNKVGKAFVSFTNNKDFATQVKAVGRTGLDETYKFLSEESSNKILRGHGVTSPILFGIRDTGGGLGNNAEELQQSYNLFYESKLKHYQNKILELINKVLNGNLLFGKIDFKTYNPFSTTEKDVYMKKESEDYNEINTQDIIKKIDLLKIKSNDYLINETLLNVGNKNSVYKFIKASNNNNIIIKKLEILSDQGYNFKYDPDIIKNTKDYYFMEQKYIKNKK